MPETTADRRPERRRFDEEVAFLRRPDSWPGGTTRVEIVPTHFACVFLTDTHAWKLKRPLRWLGLDQRALAAREESCRRELALNRRLAADVYEQVVPLVVDARGELAVGGRGEPVDWMVKMRRLPASLMLDRLLAGEGPPADRLEALAEVLARLYRRAGTMAELARDWPQRTRTGIAEQVEALGAALDDRSAALVQGTGERLLAYVQDHARMLQARAGGGCVVEGHGDLRPEHACLEPRPVVIDCLEFDRALRVLDRAEELAYLWLECEHLGRGAPGERVLRRCLEMLGDEVPHHLLAFYRASRSLLRARLALWHIEADGRHGAGWKERADLYLAMAEQFSHEARSAR